MTRVKPRFFDERHLIARSRQVMNMPYSIFPNTDLPRPANNVFIFFSLENYFIRNVFVDTMAQEAHSPVLIFHSPVLIFTV